MSARSRKPHTESLGIESNNVFGVFAAPDRRFAFFDDVLWTANGMCRIRCCDLPNDQKIVQHDVHGFCHRSFILTVSPSFSRFLSVTILVMVCF